MLDGVDGEEGADIRIIKEAHDINKLTHKAHGINKQTHEAHGINKQTNKHMKHMVALSLFASRGDTNTGVKNKNKKKIFMMQLWKP